MFGIRDRQITILIVLMFAPFALQLLGWAGTPLGGGPCGAISADQFLLEQPEAFFYAQIMLWSIALLMATGFFVLMLGFMNQDKIPRNQARPFLLMALGVGAFTALIYTLTRTIGLPTPSPVGWLHSGAEPTDAIGIMILLVLLLQFVITLRWLRQAEPATN